MKETEKYRELIDLPHHISSKHPHMSLIDRAAQFSPFAALTGYDAAINKAAIHTIDKIQLSETHLEALNTKMLRLTKNISISPQITVTYFMHSNIKEGGCYITLTGVLKKIDSYRHNITVDTTTIPMSDIYDIDSPIFTEA